MTFPINAHLTAVEQALMEARDLDQPLTPDWFSDVLYDLREAMECAVVPHNATQAAMEAARETRNNDPDTTKPRRKTR